MLRHGERVVVALACGVLAAGGCGGSGTPASPTSTPPTSTQVITLHGRVTETAPTSASGVTGAVVRAVDADGTTKSGVATLGGYYSIDGLRAGRIAVSITADGYVDVATAVSLFDDALSNFALAPTPGVVTETITGSLDSQVGTCSDAGTDKPCNIVVVPVHDAGALNATLTWNPVDGGTLAATLYQRGRDEPIQRSTSLGPGAEQITATVHGGAYYELRLTYLAGAARVAYSLKLTHPT